MLCIELLPANVKYIETCLGLFRNTSRYIGIEFVCTSLGYCRFPRFCVLVVPFGGRRRKNATQPTPSLSPHSSLPLSHSSFSTSDAFHLFAQFSFYSTGTSGCALGAAVCVAVSGKAISEAKVLGTRVIDPI